MLYIFHNMLYKSRGGHKMDNFNRHFNRTTKLIKGWFVIVMLFGLGGTIFAVWVIIKLLSHFGII